MWSWYLIGCLRWLNAGCNDSLDRIPEKWEAEKLWKHVKLWKADIQAHFPACSSGGSPNDLPGQGPFPSMLPVHNSCPLGCRHCNCSIATNFLSIFSRFRILHYLRFMRTTTAIGITHKLYLPVFHLQPPPTPVRLCCRPPPHAHGRPHHHRGRRRRRFNILNLAFQHFIFSISIF